MTHQHIIKMPDIGEGIAEVELAQWHVQPGDSVVEDQVLAEVMTDKATVEVPSPVVGKVVSLGGQVGEVLAVGAELIRLDVESEGHTASTEEAPRAPAPPVGAKTPARTATGPGSGNKPMASPAVRRHARELDIDLADVPASDSDGRISHADLDAYIERTRASGTGIAGDTRYRARDDVREVPVVGLRRKIAQKMKESTEHIPHFTYVEEVDVTGLQALRTQLNVKWGAERGSLTLLPFLIRAVVLAVREFPQINARFDDDKGVVTHYGAVHVGIATQTNAGLMVPVLRHAETRDLWSTAGEIARLAESSRAGKATRDELSGSTITITSLGALGGIVATPIINYPEVAIVGINRIVERPVIMDGAVAARKMMNLSSSFDHRVVDGLHAAEFVQLLRGYLECPATLFLS